MLIYYADDIKRQGGLLTPSILILQERWLVKRELYKWIDLSFLADIVYIGISFFLSLPNQIPWWKC